MSESVLAALDPEQRQVALTPRGPLCVLAGAGTGKTRALTHRIAYLVESGQVTSHHVLAVTFTARAAGELRTRLRGLGSMVFKPARSTPRRFGSCDISGPTSSAVRHRP